MLLTRAPLAARGGRSLPSAAARLACVKPAASVHPEPGSNSPLLVIYRYISSFQFVFFPAVRLESSLTGKVMFFPLSFFIPESVGCPSPSRCFVLWHYVIVLCFRTFPPSWRLSRRRAFDPIADAKLQHEIPLRKFFCHKILMYGIFIP